MRADAHIARRCRFARSEPSTARPRLPRSAAGFTLVELLIVLVLLIIMCFMYWGSSSASHQRQMQKSCEKNLLKAYVALDIFANEHGSLFPIVVGARTSEDALDVLVPRYTSDTSIFICPGSKDSPLSPGESLLQGRISYAYYMGRSSKDAQGALMSDRQVDAQAKTVGQLVFSSTGKPPGNNHHKFGGNVLFDDGRVELSRAHASMALGLPQGVLLLNPK